MRKNTGNADGWLWLTVPIAILMATAAASGLFIAGVYRDPPGLVAQAMGQDAVTIFVALPTLAVSALLVRRGSRRARPVCTGALLYVTYTYASYAFGIRFNALFLVYVALLGCSAYALIGGIASTDRDDTKAAFTDRAPVRGVSVFLFVVATLFYLIWLGEALPASVSGTPPQSVRDDGTPTNVIHVLDMALLLPAMIIAAVSLWRRQPLGFVLAPALLSNLALLALAILAMTLFQGREGEPVPTPLVAFFIGLSGVSAGMLIWLLRDLPST